MSARDLSLLPVRVRRSARVDPNGEVSWPFDDAESAVSALAEGGAVILGLDVWRFDGAGGMFETPWSDFRPDESAGHGANVVAGRDAAIEAMRREDAREFGDWVLVTWQER